MDEVETCLAPLADRHAKGDLSVGDFATADTEIRACVAALAVLYAERCLTVSESIVDDHEVRKYLADLGDLYKSGALTADELADAQGALLTVNGHRIPDTRHLRPQRESPGKIFLLPAKNLNNPTIAVSVCRDCDGAVEWPTGTAVSNNRQCHCSTPPGTVTRSWGCFYSASLNRVRQPRISEGLRPSDVPCFHRCRAEELRRKRDWTTSEYFEVTGHVCRHNDQYWKAIYDDMQTI